MKRLIMLVALAAAVGAAGTGLAAGFGDAAKPASAVKKGKPKPKKPYYTKVKAAVAAAEEWEQPILAFCLKKNDEDSTNLKRKVMNRPELKTFFTTNCVVLAMEIDPNARHGGNNNGKNAKLSDEERFIENARKTINGVELPASIVADAAGKPRAQVGKYVIDVGAGPWLAQLDAAFKAAGYQEGAKMTKEAQKIVDESKPDGRSKAPKH